MINFFRQLRGGQSRPEAYRISVGQRIYAVGDVHGCASELDQLLSKIAADSAECDLETRLIFLGDLMDRGPASAEVVARLCSRNLPAREHDFLMGNHEEIMLAVLDGDTTRIEGWLRYGGVQTLESYGILRDDILRVGLDLPGLMQERIPKAHIAFLRSLKDSIRIGDYLFVHAGIRPGVALEQQRPSDLRWMRSGFLDDDSDHGLIVVHGHTISDEPDIRPNRIGVDTGCYRSGTLTALVLEGTERRFISNR